MSTVGAIDGGSGGGGGISSDQTETEENYRFKGNDYQNHLSEMVRQLLDEESMVDVTLVAGGERIQAHRMVLCSCSTLFQELLSQAKDDHATIILSDISAQDMRSIVDFCYHGEVRIPVENISNLLEAAHSLKICGLMEIDGLDENDGIISAKDSTDENVESSTEFTISDDPNNEQSSVENNSTTTTTTMIDETNASDDAAIMRSKRKRRRDSTTKRDYNDDMLVRAINDLKSGQTLIESSTRNNIPRSTLYMRAKSLGIQLNASRNEYPTECMKAAIEGVIGGLSLQQASEKYYIPKTVLWRRIQKEGYKVTRSERRRSYRSEKREAAVKALQRGERLTKVAMEFQIPKTTLFRDKARLVDEGKLPESYWKKRKAGDERIKRLRLDEAVAACRGGRMSQGVASRTYRIPKTTIWRRLQQDGKITNDRLVTTKSSECTFEIDEEIEDVKSHQPDSEFTLCEVSSEIPITYMDENSLPGDSVIILTTEDVEGLEIEGERQIIVNQDSGQEYVRCALTMGGNDTSGYRPTES